MQDMGESLERKRLVNALVDELRKQGFEILAACVEGFKPCDALEGLVPDVKAYNRRKEYVVFGLAVTCSDLDNKVGEERFKLFSSRYISKGKSAKAAAPLCIAVTKGCEPKLDAHLAELKLDQKKNVFRYAF